ncbi:MAG: hypothetical protein Fur0041_02300 [Bacteroidia bacterium]
MTVFLGYLIGGYFSDSYSPLNTEGIVRIVLSLLGYAGLQLTFESKPREHLIRAVTYFSIYFLVFFGALLLYLNKLNFDSGLTAIGLIVICSLYLKSVRSLALFLLYGFALFAFVAFYIDQPQMDPTLFTYRLLIAVFLIMSLSYSMKFYQQQLEAQTEKYAAENRDLNATRSALEERLTRQQLLSLVASRANTAVIISTPDFKIEWVNPEFTRIFGYREEEVIGKGPEMFRGPDTDPEIIARVDGYKNSGTSFHEVILNYRKDGTPIWVQMHVTPIISKDGKIERYIAIEEDVTEQITNVHRLRKSQEQLRVAQHQAKIGSWEWAAESDVMDCSDEMRHILGVYSNDSFVSVEEILSFVHSEDDAIVRKTVESALKRSSLFEIEFRIVVNGIVRHVFVTGQAEANEEHTTRMYGTMQDITERKRIEEEMRIAEQQYRSLFENAQHMICIHDMDGLIMSINKAGSEALGYRPEEMIGKSVREFLTQDVRHEFDEYLKEIALQKQGKGLMKIRTRRGTDTIWMYSNIVLKDEQGRPFVLGSNVDITERFQMERELKQARLEAEKALETKDLFVANISHELRTPLNAISGFVELLIRANPSGVKMEYARAIQTASESLSSMINDLLDLAKIEAGKIEFDERPFHPREVLEKIHLLLSQRAIDAKLTFSFSCDQNVPETVLGDDLRLSQILINLVGNALKFTHQGYVHYHCSVSNETDDAITLDFTVEDTGIGIPKEKQQMIFEPFTQASPESNRRFGGTGLGLSIVKDLTELQGGSIALESEPGKGTTFSVKIPVRKASVAVPDHHFDSAKNTAVISKGLKVLLVEDHPLNQKLATKLLEDFNCKVTIASNGKEAVDFAKESIFDLIFMDLQMPEMDGFEATRIIRNELLLQTPVIALTAHSADVEKEKCRAVGMNDFVVKPYRAEELKSKLLKYASSASPVNDDPLYQLTLGDREFEKEIVEAMLVNIPAEIGNLIQALEQHNSVQLVSIAHKLKSTIALAGDEPMTKLISEMNQHPERFTDGKLSETIDELKTRTRQVLEHLRQRIS